MNDDKAIELLGEAVRWLRFQSMEKAKSAVSLLLDTDQKKIAFEMADGLLSARAVSFKIGVSDVTIGKWWNAWFSAGILFENDKTYKKLFSLSDLGIEIPNALIKKGNDSQIASKKDKNQ